MIDFSSFVISKSENLMMDFKEKKSFQISVSDKKAYISWLRESMIT